MAEAVSKQLKDDNMTVEIYLFENNTTDQNKMVILIQFTYKC